MVTALGRPASAAGSACSRRKASRTGSTDGPLPALAADDTEPVRAKFVFMSGTPRLPALTLAEADWLVEAAMAIGSEQGFPHWRWLLSTSPER